MPPKPPESAKRTARSARESPAGAPAEQTALDRPWRVRAAAVVGTAVLVGGLLGFVIIPAGQKENGQAGQASNSVSSHGYSRAKSSAEWELKAPAVKTVSNAHVGGPLQQFFGHMALLVHPPVC